MEPAVTAQTFFFFWSPQGVNSTGSGSWALQAGWPIWERKKMRASRTRRAAPSVSLVTSEGLNHHCPQAHALFLIPGS